MCRVAAAPGTAQGPTATGAVEGKHYVGHGLSLFDTSGDPQSLKSAIEAILLQDKTIELFTVTPPGPVTCDDLGPNKVLKTWDVPATNGQSGITRRPFSRA